MKKETGQSVRVGSGSVIGGPFPPTGSVPGVSRAPSTDESLSWCMGSRVGERPYTQ